MRQPTTVLPLYSGTWMREVIEKPGILRSGDVVPAAVETIDATGVRLRSPVTAGAGEDVVSVANQLVRAIELDPTAGSFKITPDRFQRLTTLPRSTHSRKWACP